MSLALAADNTASVEEAYIQTTALPGGADAAKPGASVAASATTTTSMPTPGISSTRRWPTRPSSAARCTRTACSSRAAADLAVHRTRRRARRRGPVPERQAAAATRRHAALFAHTGGDIGVSQSWRAGAVDAVGKGRGPRLGRRSTAPATRHQRVQRRTPARDRRRRVEVGAQRQPAAHQPDLQGEYFHRTESGSLVYDSRRAGARRQLPLDAERLVRAGGVPVHAGVAGRPALRPAGRRQRRRLQQHRQPVRARLLADAHDADARLVAQRIQPRAAATGQRPGALRPDRQPDSSSSTR